jgi:glutathionylspermidine synthase
MIKIIYTLTSKTPFPDASFEPKFSDENVTQEEYVSWCFANGLVGARVNMLSPTVKECIASWSSQELLDAFDVKFPHHQKLLDDFYAAREAEGVTVVRTVTVV